MRTEEEVVALFAEANPMTTDQLSDPLESRSHLDALRARSSEMSDTEIRRVERKGNHGRNTPWLVAAAVVTVVALAAVIAVLTHDDGPVADNGATTTSVSVEEPLDPAVATVHAYIEAFNGRDLEAMRPLVTPGFLEDWTFRRIVDGENVERSANFVDLLFAMNTRMDLLEPCVVSDEPNAVECHIDQTEDFHGPGFVNGDGIFTFLLDDAGLVEDWEDPTCCDRQFAFNSAFWSWLRDAHPDVYLEIADTAGETNGLPGHLTFITDMTTALGYVDEFVAQSPDYPIEGP